MADTISIFLWPFIQFGHIMFTGEFFNKFNLCILLQVMTKIGRHEDMPWEHLVFLHRERIMISLLLDCILAWGLGQV